MNHRKWAGLAPWLFLFVATGAYANMGIPMLMLAWPAYILGLIPVIAIEAFIGTRMLKLSWNDVLPATAIGNIWSTLVGIPVVWIALIALEAAAGIGLSTIDPSGIPQWVLFPFFVAWLAPTESIWVVYAAFVVLAIPFCVASIWIESRVAVKRLPKLPPESVRAWMRRANIWSYVFLVACAIAFPLYPHTP